MGGSRVASLEVPGASLHYEVRGSGPVLLIIPGMPADAGFYAVVARQLADTWTVVAYDPRGMSRSRLRGPPTDQRVEVHADDAHRVLDAVGQGPAHVLTDSVSGLVGLHLAATRPDQVRTLVAFEPPPGDPDPEVTAAMDRIGENLDFWLSHVVRPSFQGYTPDLATLRTGPTRIVVALGEASRPDQLTTRTTLALADQLGTTPVTVPGDHEAVTSHPEAYTAMVKRVLGEG